MTRAAGLLNVDDSRQITDIITRMSRLNDGGVRRRIDEAVNNMLDPAWSDELARPVSGLGVTQAKVLRGGSFTAFSGGVGIVASGAGELRNGYASPRAFEFGAGPVNREKFTRYRTKSSKGKPYTVARRTKRQMPRRSSSGWVVYPAAGRLKVRYVNLVQETIVKFYRDSIDGGNRG